MAACAGVKTINDPKLKVNSHTNWVRCVRWNGDGDHFATGSADKTVRLFTASGNEVFSVPHPDWVWSVAFSPNTNKRKRLATACLDGCIRVLDATNGRQLLEIKQHAGTVNCIDFSPDGELLLSGSYDKTARIFSATTGKQTLCIEGHNSFVLCGIFSKDSSKAITASQLGEIRITDLASGNVLTCFKAHDGPVNCLCLSWDGSLMASAGADKNVIVWDMRAQPIVSIATIKHSDSVQTAAFSPDDLLLVTGGSDAMGRVFHVDVTKQDWTELARICGHSDELNSFSFAATAGGGKVQRVLGLSASDDRSTCLWDLTPVVVALKVAQAREKKGRPSETSGGAVSERKGDPTDMDAID